MKRDWSSSGRPGSGDQRFPHASAWVTHRPAVVTLIVGGIVIALILILTPILHSPWAIGAPLGPASQVIVSNGTLVNLTGGNPRTLQPFSIMRSGTLEGSYSIAGGPASLFVCYSSQCDQFTSSGPVGHVYDSGPVEGGKLSLNLNSLGNYGVVGWDDNQTAGHLTVMKWVSPLIIVYS